MSHFLAPPSFTERILLEISEKSIYAGLLEKMAVLEGYDKSFLDIWYPEGMFSFLKEYSKACNQRLASMLKEEHSTMRVHEKIAYAVRHRILIENAHYKNITTSIFSYMTSPSRFVQGLAYYTRIVDTLWYEVGDTSTDWNYYSKRALLLGVYMSTLGFWSGDYSENHEDSWNFMNNRLYDVMRLGTLRKKISHLFPLCRFSLLQKNSKMR